MLDEKVIQYFTPKQLAVERVIAKTFATYNIDVVITNRIRAMFVAKLWRMGNKLVSLGGKGKENLLIKWKSTRWKVEIQEDEIANKQVIATATTKRVTVLQDKLNQYEKQLKNADSHLKSLQQSNIRLSNSLRSETPDGRRKRKKWVDCTIQYQNQQKKRIKLDVQTALSFTETENFQPVRVEMMNKDTKEVLSVECKATGNAAASIDNSVIEKTLYVKERFNISDVAYHELAQINPKLPRKSALAKVSKNMNSEYQIQPTSGETIGVQQSLVERLRIRLHHVLKTNPSFAFKKSIRVKITGDGTVVSRSLHLVVIAFSLLVDEENPNSPNGTHTIALLNTTEHYDNMAEALGKVIEDVKIMESITVNGATFSVEFFLCADWKFLALIVGIQAASSKHFCIWCKCTNEERQILGDWSMEDTMKGARTVDEIQNLAKSKRKSIEKYGCVRQPLFPTIQVDHIIPDVLHLFLRICDVLVNLLITDLRRLDGIDKARVLKLDRTKVVNIVRYEKFINETCKVAFHFFVDKDSKKLKWRDLTGPEKLKVFNSVDIPKLFPRVRFGHLVQNLWKEFLEIYKILRSHTALSNEQVNDLKVKIDDWINNFVDVYQTKNITPYLHVLSCHIHEFVRRYGTISQFSQQGVERLNDVITKDYYRSTNHRDALKQLLLKLNRLEELSDNDCAREKKSYKCKNCKQLGHNIRTCEGSAIIL